MTNGPPIASSDRSIGHETKRSLKISLELGRKLSISIVSCCVLPDKMGDSGPSTLGNFIASRLVEVGCTDYFCVPGDYNMILLDELNAEPKLSMIHCCNELNAGEIWVSTTTSVLTTMTSTGKCMYEIY